MSLAGPWEFESPRAHHHVPVAESADALRSDRSAEGRGSSTLPRHTNFAPVAEPADASASKADVLAAWEFKSPRGYQTTAP